jgi:hypothetical protein
MSFIKKKGSLQRRSWSPLKLIYQLDTSTLTLPPVGTQKSTALDWRNRANVAIIIATAAIVVVVFRSVISSGAIIAISSIIGVPAVISVIVFVRQPGAQETPYHRVLLGRLIIILLFQGGVMPFPGHVVIIIFIFQFSVEEELEVLAVGQGLIVLWLGPEVPLSCVPVQRSACLIGSLGVELRGHLSAGLGFSGGDGGIRGWGGHGKRRVSEMVQLLSAWGRRCMHGASMWD